MPAIPSSSGYQRRGPRPSCEVAVEHPEFTPATCSCTRRGEVLTSEKNEPDVDMLKDIGSQIIAKCDGLPLAVKVMGGLLCKKEKTRRDWEDVLNDDIWSVSRMPDELNYAIYLSYEDLSPSLKQCFLHFSLNPKKIILSLSQVVSMWIGEGFVQGDLCSLEEEGTKYYKELILRNLIERNTDYPAGLFICSMHDVILSFAKFVAKDEALVAHGGDTAQNKLRSHNFLRLSIETKGVESDEFEWRYLTNQKSLRTLIVSGKIKIQPGDSLVTFSSLRTLSIDSANFAAALIESVCHLKHLRYLSLHGCSDIPGLPENIHKMKFLQHIDLEGCEHIVKLPDSIVKLQELRYLDIDGTQVNNIPRGFGALANLRSLSGFPTNMDGDWCSLEELGPLSLLTELGIKGLENVSSTPSVAKARLGEKPHLTILALECDSSLGDDGLLKQGVSKEEVQRIEAVVDMLCPLPCLEFLFIKGYFGRHLPRWMMWTGVMPLENLRTLFMDDLACCTQLPDGLCQLPCLDYLGLFRAPAIKRVGSEFVHPHNHRHHASSLVVASFPKLRELGLSRMVKWEEWKWEEEMQAMSVLEELSITDCKLRCIPPGLSLHARSLKKLILWSVKGLHSLENFASVVDLDLDGIPYLTRISNFPKLQKLEIKCCPKVELLQEMIALRRLVLTISYSEKRLPLYLQTVKPSHLLLNCSPKVLASMAAGKSGSELDKFSHIQHTEAYADDGGIQKKWHLQYTSEPYSMKTNIEPNLEEWLVYEDALSCLAGLFRSSDDDEEGVDNNQD